MIQANIQELKPPVGLNVKIKLSDVMSEKADACMVPQYDKTISNKGASLSLSKSQAINGIKALFDKQKISRLPFGSALMAPCGGNNYRYLLNISVLGLKKEISSFVALYFSTRVALRCAEKTKLKTIVIPTATKEENNLLTNEDMSLSILKAIFDIKNELRYIKEITILVSDQTALSVYQKTLEAIPK